MLLILNPSFRRHGCGGADKLEVFEGNHGLEAEEHKSNISTDAEEEVDKVEVVLLSPKKIPNLNLTPPERKRKFSMRRSK